MPEVILIDSDTLRSRIGELCINNDELFSAKAYERIIGVIDATPTIEAEPVRHGRWIPVDGEPYAKCSYCGEKHYGCTTPYCDMCGAYMRKGGADNGCKEML